MDEESPEQRQFYGYIREYTVSFLEYTGLLVILNNALLLIDNFSASHRLVYNILPAG